jgi:hypothetical protein
MVTGFRIFRELFESEGSSIGGGQALQRSAEYANDFVMRRDAYERKLRDARLQT